MPGSINLYTLYACYHGIVGGFFKPAFKTPSANGKLISQHVNSKFISIIGFNKFLLQQYKAEKKDKYYNYTGFFQERLAYKICLPLLQKGELLIYKLPGFPLSALQVKISHDENATPVNKFIGPRKGQGNKMHLDKEPGV